MKVQFDIRRINITATAPNGLRESLERLQRLIPISAASVVLEHRCDRAPGFRAFASLAVPGPDLHAEARDQTLGVAWLRVRAALRKQIEQRQVKQLISRIKSARERPILTAVWLKAGVPELISLKTIKRVAILLIGSTVLAVGVALLVLPGPAFIVIPAGFAILAIEFAWARRWLRKARNMLPDTKGAGGFSSFVARHVKNFLEWASVLPHENIRGQKERKDKGMKPENKEKQLLPAENHLAEDEVAQRAYELYEARGREPGHDLEDWLHAEQEVNERHQLIQVEK